MKEEGLNIQTRKKSTCLRAVSFVCKKRRKERKISLMESMSVVYTYVYRQTYLGRYDSTTSERLQKVHTRQTGRSQEDKTLCIRAR